MLTIYPDNSSKGWDTGAHGSELRLGLVPGNHSERELPLVMLRGSPMILTMFFRIIWAREMGC